MKIKQDLLKNIAYEHLSYEIEMFNLSADKLRSGTLSTLEKNAFLEIFLVHARCLINFLYPDKKNIKDDDVLAEHFFDNPKGFSNQLPQIQDSLKKLLSRVGKEVAHLTYKRTGISPELKQWDINLVQRDLNDDLSLFFKSLSDKRLSWFRVIVK